MQLAYVFLCCIRATLSLVIMLMQLAKANDADGGWDELTPSFVPP